MEFEFDEDIARLIRDVRDIRERWFAVATDVVDQWAEIVADQAKRNAPQESGDLRESIVTIGARVAGDVVQGSVLSGAEYSSFVESRDPYLGPAVEQNIEDLVRILVEEFDKLFDKGVE